MMGWDQGKEIERVKMGMEVPNYSGTDFAVLPRRHPVIPSLRRMATPSSPVPANRIDKVLDWFERLLVLSLYAWLVFRIVSSYIVQGGFVNLLLLPSEGVVVLFLLIRRRAASISRHPSDWVVALLGTSVGLLVIPVPGRALVWLQLAAPVLLGGFIIQVIAKIALGRSFGCVPAHRGLKISGPYRFVRHPMYAGYLLSQLAFLAVNPSLWNGSIYAVQIALQLYRLGAEEHLLSRDPRYGDYRRAVRYRLLPGLF